MRKDLLKLLLLLLILALGLLLRAQTINSESFDGATFPPTGWTRTVIANGSGMGSQPATTDWSRVTSGTNPTCSNHSGAGMAQYASASVKSGGIVTLVTPSFDLSARGSNTPTVSFWMYRDNGSSSAADKIDVLMNTSTSVTGATSLGTINRSRSLSPTETADGWYQYTFNIPAAFSGTANFIIFQATSAHANNMFIDDVQWIAYPPTAPAVTLHPTSATRCDGTSVSFTSTASGALPPTVQWQVSTNGGSSWSNVSGETSTTYTFTVSASQNSNQYRAVFTNASGTANSNAATLTVNSLPSAITSSNQSICIGQSTTIGASAVGGNTYNWTPSTALSSATAANPTANPTSSTTYTLTETVTATGCQKSNSVTVTVLSAIGNNSITTAQTICSGQTPASLNCSAPTGGNGSYNYLWESSTTSSSTGFASASGTNNTQNYSPAALTQTTWYRRVVSSGACTGAQSLTSNVIEMTVQPAIASNSISAAQTICSGQTASTLNGSAPTGGDGSNYTFLWESSTTSSSSGFASASGTNNAQNYSSAALAQTTWYRRKVTSGQCSGAQESVSNVIEITFQPALGNNSINVAQTICSGQTPSTVNGSTPTGGDGSSYNYLWESSTTSSSSGFTSASGTNNVQNYSPAALTQTTWFRRKVTSGQCSGAQESVSNVIEITFQPALANNSISAAQTICSGQTPSTLNGSIPTGGDGSSYNYLWESSTTSSSSGFATASGTNNAQNYSPAALTQTTWYRRVVSSGACSGAQSLTSNVIEITVQPSIANSISLAQTICSGQTPSTLNGSVPTGGDGSNYTFLWESSTTSSSSGFAAASGTNDAQNYSQAALTQTTWYRRKITSGQCTGAQESVSNVIETTFHPALASNSISAAQTICSGQTPATLNGSSPTGGDGSNYTFLWESSTTSSSSGFAAASGTNDVQNYSAAALTQTIWYRRIVSSGACSGAQSLTSNTIEITVQPAIANNSVSSAQTICSGQTPSTLNGSAPTGGDGSNYTFLWESSTTSSSSGFAAASGTNNTQNYSPAALTQTTWYRRKVTSGQCSGTQESVSNVIEITFQAAIGNNSISAAQTICSGQTPSTLNGSTPTGGDGSNYNFLWESSTTSSSSGFAAASGTNDAQNYSPATLTQTTWFRRKVTSGQCSGSQESISNVIEITFQPALGNNTISAAQLICSGQTPSTLNGSAPTGGDGSGYTFLWESSTTSSSSGFAAASGTISAQNYSPAELTQTTWYRRVVSSGACSGAQSLTSNVIEITVQPAIANNGISSAQTICSGQTPATLSGSAPTGGDGSNYTFLWESSPTSSSSGFAAASGTNDAQNYSPTALTQTTWYRRKVTSGQCSGAQESVSNVIEITFQPAIGNNSISAAQTICSGQTPSTLNGSVPTGGDGSNYTFLWESSTTSSSSGFAAASGTNNTQNYSPGALTQTTWYRRTVTSSACAGAQASVSTAIEITVQSALGNNTISAAQTICESQTPTALTGSAPTGGNGSYTYLWESSTTSAVAGFAAASGTNDAQNYSPATFTQTTWFRRKVTSGQCSGAQESVSNVIEITFQAAIGNNSISAAQTICSGQTPSTLNGSTPTGGDGSNYNYLWESSTTSSSSGFATAIGTNDAQNYSPSALTQTTWFRRKVTSGQCSGAQESVSNVIEITFQPVLANNGISAAQTICSGQMPSTLNGSAPTGGDGSNYTFLWESSTTSSSSGFTAASGTNNTQNYSAAALIQTTWYRRVVSSGACSGAQSLTSNVIEITVQPAIANNNISSAQTICSGQTPSTLNGSAPTGGDGSNYSFLWESSTTSSSSGFAAASGTNNTQNYSPTALAQTNWFRRKVISGQCSGAQESISNVIEITFHPAIGNNSVSAAQTICSGQTPATLNGSAPTGGDGNSYNYLWESSTTSSSSGFAAASGTNNTQNYSSSALTQTNWFRRKVTSGQCSGAQESVSNVIEITFQPALANNSISAAQTICSGQTPSTLNGSTPTGGDGSNYTFLWQSSTTSSSSGFASASGTNDAQNYSPTALTQTTWYRRVVSSGACSGAQSLTSNVIEITVQPAIANNSISAAQAICSGQTPSTLNGSAPTGGDGSNYTLLWESSTTSSSSGFAAASGTNDAQNYSPAALTQTTWYRRKVTSGQCSGVQENVSNVIEITFQPALGNNSISAAQTICSGQTPSTLNGSAPTGGDGSNYTFLWQSSTTSSSSGFATASGTNNTQNYSPAALTQTVWYGRKVISGQCSGTQESISNVIEMTVQPSISNNTISAAQTICTGTAPSPLSGSSPTGGDGSSYNYLWESSTTSSSSGFSNAGGTNNTQNYSPSSLTQTTWFRRVVTSGQCSGTQANTSGAIQITVDQLPVTPGSITGSSTVCQGQNAVSYSVPAITNATSYVWSLPSGASIASGSGTRNITVNFSTSAASGDITVYGTNYCGSGPVSANFSVTVNPLPGTPGSITGSAGVCVSQNGVSYSVPAIANATGYIWTLPSGASIASGNNTSSITVNFASNASSGNITVKGTNACGNGPVSANFAVTVTPLPGAAGAISGPNTICAGNGGYNYTVPSISNATGYTWTLPTGATIVSGANTNSITIDMSTSAVSGNITVRGTNACGNGTVSANFAVTVNPAMISAGHAQENPVCETSGNIHLKGDGQGFGVMSWSWTGPNGFTSDKKNPNPFQATLAGEGWYTVVNVDENGCSGTASFYVTVKPAPVQPTITAGGPTTFCAGGSVTLTSSTDPSYASLEWSTGATTTSITVTTSGSYTLTATGINACPSSEATPVTVTVNPLPTVSPGSNQTICFGQSTTIGAMSAANRTYSWSPSGTLSSATVSNPTATPTVTTTYTLTVTNTITSCQNTGSVTITVQPAIGNNIVSAAQTICSGQAPAQLTGTVPTGGNGSSYSYQWQSSTDGSSFSNISGATSLNYSPSTLTQNTWYRRVASSGQCTGAQANTSASIQITVLSSIANNTVSAAQTICNGQTPSGLTGSVPTGGNGTYGYAWESSTTSATTGFSAATGTNNVQDYSPGTLTQTTWYRRKVTSGQCTGAQQNTSTAIQITVLTLPANNTISANQNICIGDTPAALAGSTPTGGNGTYAYLWENSTTSSSSGFSAASGTNSGQNYSPPALTQTTWFRRTVTSGPCTGAQSNTSAVVTITVTPISNNTISVVGNAGPYCVSGNPTSISGSAPTGATGAYTYQWQSSTDGSNYTNISGATSQNYVPPTMSALTWIRRTVNSGTCSDNSASKVFVIHQSISNNVFITAAQTICNGDSLPVIGSMPTGGDSTYTYTWEKSANNSSWSGVNGAAGKDYQSPSLTDTTYYKRGVKSGACNTFVYTASIKITVLPINNSLWRGTLDNDWDKEENWLCGIPDYTTNVIIQVTPNKAVVFNGVLGKCNTIFVDFGAEVEIQSGGRLNVKEPQ